MAAANVGAISQREWRTAQECILAQLGDPQAGAAGGAVSAPIAFKVGLL